ncbi:MAG TPA: TOBE domain-containing protein, partial [Ramlibacter sp.]|nr:TOBE domain-containing protein [Ramlibacter sp.]
RPEHLDIGPSGWPLQVETTELLGAERLIYGRLGTEQVIVRSEENQAIPEPGSTIHVQPREDRVHWFDATTTKRM